MKKPSTNADPALLSKDGETPEQVALAQKHSEAAKFLTESIRKAFFTTQEIRKFVPDESNLGKRANAALEKQSKEVFKILDALGGLLESQLKDMLKLNGMPTQKFGQAAAFLVGQRLPQVHIQDTDTRAA